MLISERIIYDLRRSDYSTKKDIKDLETKIEKGFKEVIIWVVAQ